jgi:membrane protease subunit HflC
MKPIATLILAAVVVAAGLSCLIVVDQTEYAVQMRFGDPVRTMIEPGLHFKYPWPVDTVARFDNRLMVLENPAPGESDKEYLTQDEQSGIGKNVVVTTYTCWRIKRSTEAVLRFLETMGDRARAEARLGDVVVSELGAALGQHDFSVLVSSDPKQRAWGQFLESIRVRCAQRVEDSYGIEVVDVKIQRLNFPRQNRRNVFDRMRAERETIAARYRSEGEEKAAEIRAQADRQREEILARAYEDAERIRGEADAKAARIYAEAYGRDEEFYGFLRTLQAYEVTLNEGTVAILSGSSDFLRLLNQASASGLDSPAGENPQQQPAVKLDSQVTEE